MATNTVTNWFGNIVSHPQVVVEANSVDDIVRVVKDPAAYPSPVRAVGSNHSTAPCGVADGGTLIQDEDEPHPEHRDRQPDRGSRCHSSHMAKALEARKACSSM